MDIFLQVFSGNCHTVTITPDSTWGEFTAAVESEVNLKFPNIVYEGDVKTCSDPNTLVLEVLSGIQGGEEIFIDISARAVAEDRLSKAGIHRTVKELIMRSNGTDNETLELLIDAGVPAEAMLPGSIHGHTALHVAAKTGAVDTCRLLLAAGVSTSVTTKLLTTPLHEACHKGRSQVANLLIQNGADVNSRNRKKVSPLMLACSSGNNDVVRALLLAGADMYATDCFKSTSWDYCYTENTKNILRRHLSLK